MPLVRKSLPIQFKKSPTLLFDIIHHIKEAGTDSGFSMWLEGGGGGACQSYFISLWHAGGRAGPFCPSLQSCRSSYTYDTSPSIIKQLQHDTVEQQIFTCIKYLQRIWNR